MAQMRFETDNLPAAAFGLQLAALHLIEELAKHRPDKSYFDNLRRITADAIKNAVPDGLPMEEETSFIETSLGAADFIFDHVGWR